MSLTSRHIEEQGIPTVVLGCAKDLVETCGVARFVWSDFPLGNSCGKPNDAESQRTILAIAFDLLESACAPMATVRTPFRWRDDPSWKKDFYSLEVPPEQLAKQKAEFDRQKAIAKTRAEVHA